MSIAIFPAPSPEIAFAQKTFQRRQLARIADHVAVILRRRTAIGVNPFYTSPSVEQGGHDAIAGIGITCRQKAGQQRLQAPASIFRQFPVILRLVHHQHHCF